MTTSTCARSTGAGHPGRPGQTRHEARIHAGGVDEDVTLVAVGDVSERVDAAHRAKCGRRYPAIVPSIVAPAARAATRKLVPR